MKASKKPARWSNVKAGLAGCDRQGLMSVIKDLYDANGSNRRFLHARFVPDAATLEEYRRLVADAVFPDPIGNRPIRLRDATAAIAEYRRSTGDVAGTVDLMLEFVEAGTEQAADLGYGDEAYFTALERKVTDIVGLLGALADGDRAAAIERLVEVQACAESIGCGYGDFLSEVVAKL
jgi:hypothetical protein